MKNREIPGLPLAVALLVCGSACRAFLASGAEAGTAPLAAENPEFTDDRWISMSAGIPGADAAVSALATDSEGNLFVGGSFKVVGDIPVNGIARWDGRRWFPLASGVNGIVQSIAVSGRDVFAGGNFTTGGSNPATNIAHWNGSQWASLGSGVDGGVMALAVAGTNVYAGGSFAKAGGVPASNIAVWNGSRWSALGSGIAAPDTTQMSGAVFGMAVVGDDLYVAGGFTTAGAKAASCVAKWNGTSWSALGGGFSGPYPWASALVSFQGEVYAGGYFSRADGALVNHIAKWNGSRWSAVGSGLMNEWGEGFVSALAVWGDDLYAAGSFNNVRGDIAKWDGSRWSPLGGGVSRGVGALALMEGVLYSGGWFTSAGDTNASGIAKWDGQRWSALGTGISPLYDLGVSPVNAVVVVGRRTYVGGNFTTTDGGVCNRIAEWDGNVWRPLGSGMNGPVQALATSGNEVYAAGGFSLAGGVEASNIARWNGNQWSALGSGLGGCCFGGSSVHALAISGTHLYAAGTFLTAGGNPAARIAQWDGNQWSALGSGIEEWRGSSPDFPPTVHALATHGNDVFAAGVFHGAGGVAATNIAKWDGTRWSALGSGLDGWVMALAVSGDNVYAAGQLLMPGDSERAAVARWDGRQWSTLGSGLGGICCSGAPAVHALAVSGDDVYVGGGFATAGGVPAAGIAVWRGTAWSGLGSGLGGGDFGPSVRALAMSGSDVYVGGLFALAGGKVSGYVAKAVVSPPVLQLDPDPSGGYFVRFSGFPNTGYRVERGSALAGPWSAGPSLRASKSGQVEFRDSTPPPGAAFYRAVQP